jgi:hypothetical protein
MKIAADVVAVGEDVALHGALDVFFAGAWLQIQFGVQRVELEEIAVDFACGPGEGIGDRPGRNCPIGGCRDIYS